MSSNADSNSGEKIKHFSFAERSPTSIKLDITPAALGIGAETPREPTADAANGILAELDAVHAERRQLLKELTPVAALQLFYPQGPWSLVALDPNSDGGPCDGATYKSGQEAEMAAWIAKHDGKNNLYFHINRLRDDFDKRRASRVDVTEVHYLQVDIDIKDIDWSAEVAVQRAKDAILEKLRNYPIPPTIITFSGGGYQAFWRLRKPIPGSACGLAEACSRKIAKDLNGDACHSSDHIFRLAATLNVLNKKKRSAGRKRALAEVVEYNEDRVYGLEEFLLPERGEFKPQRPARPIKPEHVKPLIDMIYPVLNLLRSDCAYEVWFDVILAIHDFSSGNEQFFDMLDTWSARGKSYNPKQLKQIWTYGDREDKPEDRRVTINRLFDHVRGRKVSPGHTDDTMPDHPLGGLVIALRDAKKAPNTREARAAAGLPFEDDNLLNAALLKAYMPAEFYKLKAALKGHIGVTAWEKQVDKKLSGEDIEEGRRTAVDLILEVASEVRLFKTAKDQAVAAVTVDEHVEYYLLRSRKFKNWLTHTYREQTGNAVDKNAIAMAIDTLEADALVKGELTEVFLRTAELNGKHYIDLCNDAWEVIEIDSGGWRIISNPPVKFVRNPGMLELLKPVRRYSPKREMVEFRKLFSLMDKRDFPLIVAFELAATQAKGPYAILNYLGTSTAGKTSATKVSASLIDPYSPQLLSPPRNEEDLYTSASIRHIAATDNMQAVPQKYSDHYCRVSTGTGWETRKFYEQGETFSLEVEKPQIWNGINEIARQPDLINRVIVIELVEPKKRLGRDEYIQKYEAMRPHTLAALLDIFVHGLQELQSGAVEKYASELEQIGHLNKYVKFGLACASAYCSPDALLAAYKNNVTSKAEASADGNDTITTIVSLLNSKPFENGWSGTASELLEELENIADNTKVFTLPKDAARLGRWLRTYKPSLEGLGITVDLTKARTVMLQFKGDPARGLYPG